MEVYTSAMDEISSESCYCSRCRYHVGHGEGLWFGRGVIVGKPYEPIMPCKLDDSSACEEENVYVLRKGEPGSPSCDKLNTHKHEVVST